MSKYKIGSYEIKSKGAYDKLVAAKKTSTGALKNFDKNNDKKISEDELQSLQIDNSDLKKVSSSTSDASKSETALSKKYSGSANASLSKLHNLDNKCLRLEAELQTLKNKYVAGDTSVKPKIQKIEAELDGYEETMKNYLSSAIFSKLNSSGSSNVSGITGIKAGSSNFGNNICAIANSFVGKLKESDGSYLQVTGGRHEAWCADFATYVVKQAAAKSGVSLNGFGSASVSGLRSWGQSTGRYRQIGGNRAQWIKQNVSPGDIVIFKENGSSHTGIVTGVNADGSFNTTEGNTSDQCLKRSYPPSVATLSGFIKMS